jgi:hypothetical protein
MNPLKQHETSEVPTAKLNTANHRKTYASITIIITHKKNVFNNLAVKEYA